MKLRNILFVLFVTSSIAFRACADAREIFDAYKQTFKEYAFSLNSAAKERAHSYFGNDFAANFGNNFGAKVGSCSEQLKQIMLSTKTSAKEFAHKNPQAAFFLGAAGVVGGLYGLEKVAKALRWQYIQRKPLSVLMDNAHQEYKKVKKDLHDTKKLAEKLQTSVSEKDKKKLTKEIKKQLQKKYHHTQYPFTNYEDLLKKHKETIAWHIKILTYKYERSIKILNNSCYMNFKKYALVLQDCLDLIKLLETFESQIDLISEIILSSVEFRLEQQEMRINFLENHHYRNHTVSIV